MTEHNKQIYHIQDVVGKKISGAAITGNELVILFLDGSWIYIDLDYGYDEGPISIEVKRHEPSMLAKYHAGLISKQTLDIYYAEKQRAYAQDMEMHRKVNEYRRQLMKEMNDNE